MKYCPKCGFENANYAKFCVKCGNSFVDMDINTIKKHNSIMNSMHLKETSEISQKKRLIIHLMNHILKIMGILNQLLNSNCFIYLMREKINTGLAN